MMREAGRRPDVLHTSLQVRAIRTANGALDVLGRLWIPVRRSWRLNERHYGDLTGKNKAETTAEHGEEQVKVWRRSYDVPPPAIAADNQFNPNDDVRYAGLPPELVPAERVPRRRRRPDVALLVRLDRARSRAARQRSWSSAHGNSLRALVKHLDGISDDEITELNIPTGVPLRLRPGRRTSGPTESTARRPALPDGPRRR